MSKIFISITLTILCNALGSLYAMEMNIWKACDSGNTKQVKLLIEQNNTLVDAQSGYVKWTPLHYASNKGHTKTAAFLLQHNANVNAQDIDKCIPLHYASENGHTEIAALLLKHKAHVNAQNITKITPLHVASNKGHTKTAALLLQHNANPNTQDNHKWTPLYLASYHGRTETMKLLLSYGATPHKPINLFAKFAQYSQIYASDYESWISKTFLPRNTIRLLLRSISRQKQIPLPEEINEMIVNFALADEVQEWEQFKKENPDVAELARLELP